MTRIMAILLAALVLGACAGREQRDDASAYLAHASSPVDQVRFAQLRSWRVLDDEWVMLRAQGNEHFLVRVALPCAADLRFATELSLRDQSRLNTLTRFDDLWVDGQRCGIRELRTLDRDGLRQAGLAQ